MNDRPQQPVTGPSAWTSAELAADDGWIYLLTDAEIKEIEAALEAVLEKGLKAFEFGREDFPLPSLAERP